MDATARTTKVLVGIDVSKDRLHGHGRPAGLAFCPRRMPGTQAPGDLLAHRRRIAALAGLAPFARQSGQWRGKGVIGGERNACRAVLFVGA